jgi:type II pantothenate kinase
LASKPDLALGIINLVFQTIGMISVFATRIDSIKDVILTGNQVNVPQAHGIFDDLGRLFGVNFHIPVNAEYATAVGTAIVFAENMPFSDVG